MNETVLLEAMACQECEFHAKCTSRFKRGCSQCDKCYEKAKALLKQREGANLTHN